MFAFPIENDSHSRETSDPMVLLAGQPHVRERIFQSLPTVDLLNSGRVSKKWRQEVVAALRSKKVCAIVNSYDGLIELNSFVAYSEQKVLNGLRLNLTEDHTRAASFSQRTMQSHYGNLLRLPIKYLQLHVGHQRLSRMLMKSLLIGCRENLMELNVIYKAEKDEPDDLLTGTVSVKFPLLERIEFGPEYCGPFYDLKKIIPLAPNLRVIGGLLSLYDFQMQSEVFRLLTDVKCLSFKAMRPIFTKFVQAEPKLRRLEIYEDEHEVITPYWSRHLMQLLKGSALTLNKLSICAMELLKWGMKTCTPFENLECLELFFPEEATIEHFELCVNAINLHLTAPRVSSLRLNFSDHCYHKIPSAIPAAGYTETAALSVLELKLEDAPCSFEIMRITIKAFPSVATFGFETVTCIDVCEHTDPCHCYEICKLLIELEKLERLRICVEATSGSFTLDAMFCGISTQESELLRTKFQKDQQGLQMLQFCPVRPPVTHLRKLKEILVVFHPKFEGNVLPISEVSGHLVFSRRPNLKLRMESHTPGLLCELGQLAAFAEIVHITNGQDWW